MKTICKDKKFMSMMDHLVACVGYNNAGKLVAILCDAIDNYANGSGREMRTMGVTFNDYFNLTFDFIKGEYVNGTK